MANKTVKLFIRVRFADGKRPFLKPVFTNQTKLKPLFAIVNGRHEHHPEACYYLRYALGTRRIWEKLTNQPDAAIAALLRKKAELIAGKATAPPNSRKPAAEGSAAGEVYIEEGRATLANAIAAFLEEVHQNKAPKTYAGYRYDLDLFQQSCRKQLSRTSRRRT